MWLLVVMGVSLVTGLIVGPLLARAADRESVPLVHARRRRAARIAADALRNRVAAPERESEDEVSESAHLN